MIVIIGGSGFVGTRLCCALLKAGLDFMIIDKVPSLAYGERWVHGDVRDIDSLRAAIPVGSIIINLAAEHRDDVRPVSLYHDVNVTGAKNICDVAEERDVKKIIFTSSVACYGFAPPGTDESGRINPFNEYGRTKAEAETFFSAWQARTADRSLIIVRPTVIFGEQNRGNVYNLLRQIESRKFVMIGDGTNVKSMAYVENVASFLVYSLKFGEGRYVYNYVDKPDLDMNSFVVLAKSALGREEAVGLRLPYVCGYILGKMCDLASKITGRRLLVSSIRVKKFCATTQFGTSVVSTGFSPPVALVDAMKKTIKYEFMENRDQEDVVFYSE